MPPEKKLVTKNYKVNYKKDRITFEDIASCSDLETLEKWKLYLVAQIVETKQKIVSFNKGWQNGKKYEHPKQVYVGLLGYKHVLGLLCSRVQLRQRELKYEKKTFFETFLQIAQSQLPEDVFRSILEETRKAVKMG